MYLLVAYEQIPTFLIGRYYCATQAGITVYKTPDQWLAENSGPGGAIVWQRTPPQLADNVLNPRLVHSVRRDLMSIIPVNIITQEIRDAYSGEVLVREVAVSTGYDKRGGMGALAFKIWAGNFLCSPGYSSFLAIKKKYREIGKEVDL
ncbi:hypothetical protein JLK41_11780 [Ectopseudomonas khazarica]|uniref:hypothetical protein n=1 Tax=Ectopseudomonas khazarica TaxID=2502979 RepID=UPI001AEFA1FA|nr:hypothetical protein [Pseudomonas khazarica]QTS88790.1 hypothetical protein JLK41_11780 [Pseudomonas khazarica]